MADFDFDALIDELAFGKARRKPGPCLGLFLSPEVIYIAETRRQGDKIVVDHLVRIPVPAPEKAPAAPTGTLNTDFLTDNQKLAAVIKQSMGAIKWSTKDVFVTLSHHLGLLRYFTMPAIDRRFWAAAVPLESKKYIPIPFDALTHDFQVVPMAPDAANKPRQGALICVTQRRNIANITALLDSLGLKMIGMEVAPCSVLRVWETLDTARAGKTHCQVHFDGGSIRILLADHGLPVFFRELFLGQEAQLSDQRKVDLAGCVGFAQKQLGVGPVGQFFVSGNTANLPQWQEAFTREIEVQAAVQDTPQRLGIKAGDWGGYAAIGASLRLLAPTPISLDLGQIGRVSEDERRTARAMLVLAGAASLFFALVGIYRSLTYNYHAMELQKYRSDPQIEAVFRDKAQPQIDEMMRGMRAQIQSAGIVENDTPRTTALLADVVNSLPDNTWLTQIHLDHAMLNTNADAFMMVLKGRAKGASMAAEQELAFDYRQRLLNSQVAGKTFRDIQVEVQGKPLPENAGPQGDPDALQSQLEDRTEFTVTLKKK